MPQNKDLDNLDAILNKIVGAEFNDAELTDLLKREWIAYFERIGKPEPERAEAFRLIIRDRAARGIVNLRAPKDGGL